MVAQATKRYARRRVTGVVRRIVRGTETEVQAWLRSTQGSATTAVINTAYIERLHRPPFAPGWLLWCAGRGRWRVRGRRWRWACGW